MTPRSLRRVYPALLLTALLLILASAAHAKGPPDKLTISGPGLDGEVKVTDPALLTGIGFVSLEDFDHNQRSGIPQPAVGEGYTLVRHLRQSNGSYEAWDQVRYYPNPDGERSYVFYDGLIGPNSTEFDGKWYYAKPQGDEAMRRLLSALGAWPVTQSLPATSADAGSYGWLIGLGGALLLAGALSRRRLRTADPARRHA